MQTFENSLQNLGLTINETTIYIYLLKQGLSSGTDIYTDNQMDKSSAYEAIANLNKKGLLYVVGQKRNQKFGAIPANKLYELVEKKEDELKKVKTNISSLIENIDEYAKQNYKNKNIRIIDGQNGFKIWAFDRLTAPKGTIIREISSNLVHQEFFANREDLINYSAVEMPQERIKRGLHIKAIMKEADITKFPELSSIERTDPKLLKEVRLIPKDKDFDLLCSLNTYGDNTALLRKFKGEFLGLIINDKLITSLVNSMFDFIWLYCKEV